MRWLAIVFGIATIVLGTAGFIATGAGFYEAFINSLSFLVLNGPPKPGGFLIEAARFCGLIFGGNVVIAVIETAWGRLSHRWIDFRNRSRIRRGEITTAVHGDGVFAKQLLSHMGGEAIAASAPGTEEASVHALLFSSDDDALRCLNAQGATFEAADEVYINLDSVNVTTATRRHIFGFSMAQIAAELYWRMYPVTRKERIAIVGSGAYAQEVILHALLMNIYDVPGGITYRAFGDFTQFRNLHPQFDKAVTSNHDVFTFADGDWTEEIGWLKECDRVVLCDSSEANIRIASHMRAVGINCALHVRCDSEEGLSLLGDVGEASDTNSFEPEPHYSPKDGQVRAFGTARALATKAIVIQQKHHEDGKICDIAYRLGCTAAAESMRQWAKDAGKDEADLTVFLECPFFVSGYVDPVDPTKSVAGWDEYDEFTKASNYAVAAHDRQKLRLLAAYGIDPCELAAGTSDAFTEHRDELQEIEHIRWMRFHYLHGWDWGDVETFPNKKNKWPQRRLHSLLVPYEELTREDKDKDAFNYETLCLRRAALIASWPSAS